jgi:predicted  nucleic acid-binding Zn-ribbon protein
MRNYTLLKERAMYEEPRVVNTLSDKINDLLAKYEELKAQNESLRNEIVSVKAQNEAKDAQIAKLQEELRAKELESEDIFEKIEEVLGR